MSHDELLMAKLESIEQKVDRACRLLEGNGEPEKGLIVRVDRIEQKWKYLAGAFAMAITAFGKVLYDWVKP